MNKLEKTAIISAFATAIIAIVKFLVGTLFGSVALVADAIHSFTDIIGSVAVFFGARFSNVKSKKFPYGLYKLENLISLLLSLLIFYTAFEILISTVEGFGLTVERANSITILAAVFSLIVSFALAKYKFKVGKKENSPSMLSEAKHTQLDGITTIGVLVAVTASFLGFPFLDPIIGFFIALIVFKAGIEIFIGSARVLLDASLDYKTIQKIERIAEQYKEIKIKDLAARSSGKYIFIDLKLETNLKDLKKVNQLKLDYEEKIKKAIPRLDKIMIDTEYKKKNILLYAVPLIDKKEDSLIALEFSQSPYFGLLKLTNTSNKKELISKKIIKNPYLKEKTKRGILTAEMLTKNKVDVLVTLNELHKGGAFYALEDNFIEMQQTNKKRFNQIINEFILEGKK
jgi:cation diffusion facilitator family transporter